MNTEGKLVSLFLVDRTSVLFISVSCAMPCKIVGNQNNVTFMNLKEMGHI